MAFAFGYTNASWTLKGDLTCEYVCRLLAHMDSTATRSALPRNNDPSVQPQPFIDFSSGYVQRSIDRFPEAGLEGARGACTRTTRSTSSRCGWRRSRTGRWSSSADQAAVQRSKIPLDVLTSGWGVTGRAPWTSSYRAYLPVQGARSGASAG